MIFDLLDKDGTKNLSNLLNYLRDNESIENQSIKTRFGKESYRKEVIISSFKHLKDRDKEELINYIKNNKEVLSEFILAFNNFNNLDEKEEISIFLFNLMTNITDKDSKTDIFILIFINNSANALDILYKIPEYELKEKFCERAINYNIERGYIYSILNNIDVKDMDGLDYKKLLREINYLEFYNNKEILKTVLNRIKDKEKLIEEINADIKLKEFRTCFTISKNIEILDQYRFNMSEKYNRKELLLLKNIIESRNLKQGRYARDINITEDIKNNSEKYSSEWLIFLSINLLTLEAKDQNLATSILKQIIIRENNIEDYSDQLEEPIKTCILGNKALRSDLFMILNQLDLSESLGIVIELIEKESLKVVQEKSIRVYISNKVKETPEYKWIEKTKETNEFISSNIELNLTILTLILKNEPIKQLYELLSLLRNNEKRMYKTIMEDFTQLIIYKIDADRYIQIMILLDYKNTNEDIINMIEEYQNQNKEHIKVLLNTIHPRLLSEYYSDEIIINIKANRIEEIIILLNKIEDIEIKKECSLLIIDELIDTRIFDLIQLWEYLELNVNSQIRFRKMLFELINNGKINLTVEVIEFADKIGIDAIELYNLINDNDNKEYLLDILYKSERKGTIVNIIRKNLIQQVNFLEDIKDIEQLIKRYTINDNDLKLLIKVKVYTSITIELLEIDLESVETPTILNGLIDLLEDYKLVDRFLTDDLIKKELDRKISDYIVRKLMEKNNSTGLMKFYWEGIVSDINNVSGKASKEKLDIFFNSIAKSKEKIEWFLDTIEDSNDNKEINMNIFETLLMLLNKNNRIMLQNIHETEVVEEQLLNSLGNKICNSLSNLEKTVISKSIDSENDIIIENIKNLRKNLQAIGIYSVEDIDNYGEKVKFDSMKHEIQKNNIREEGVVDSLGLMIKDSTIIPSTLLNVD